MNWLFFALLAPLLSSIVNFVDKYLVVREVPDYRGMVIFTSVMGLLAGTLFWIVGGFPRLEGLDLVLVLVTGMLTTWAAAFYFRGMTSEEASSVIMLLQMTPVLTFIMSFVFLGEILSPRQFLGFALILFAAVSVSRRGGRRDDGQGGIRLRLSPAFWDILAVDVLSAGAFVLFKFVSGSQPFGTILAYESWGIALGGLLLYIGAPRIRHAFNHDAVTMRRRGFSVIFLNEGLFVVAKLTSFLAVSLGSATLTSVLGSTGIFFGILLGWVLTLLAPHIFKEDITRRNLLRKGALAAILFVGILLVG